MTKPRWKLPLHIDKDAMYIWDANHQMIAEIRGWGHLTGTGGLRLNHDEAVAVQKARVRAFRVR